MAKHVTVEIPGHIAERINTEIVSEWNCESIRIESWMKSEEVADYCNKVSKRTDRPMGSTLMVKHSSPVELVFDILHSKMNARKTVLNDRWVIKLWFLSAIQNSENVQQLQSMSRQSWTYTIREDVYDPMWLWKSVREGLQSTKLFDNLVFHYLWVSFNHNVKIAFTEWHKTIILQKPCL